MFLDDERLVELGEFFVKAPLYSPITLPTNTSGQANLHYYVPGTVRRACEQCEQLTIWELTSPLANSAPGSSTVVGYRCRNCRKMGFFVWLVWSLEGLTATFEKYGQYPKLEIHPPKRLEKVLGKEHTKLYSKGLTSRHHGYGIGAHAYFRRIVEETTDDMLDAVVAAMEEAGANATDTEKVRQIKKGNTYEDKVRLVAGILPRVLRPGDANPFAILHELLSKGLHSLTDEECLEIVDGMNKILEYIFVELKAHTTERKAFASGLHALQKKLRNKKTS